MLAILLTATIGALLLLTIYSVSQRTLRARAGEALAAEQERFRITLANIGDGVITTDAEGRVTGLNAVAGQLCGCALETARGRLLTEIVQVQDESTRQPVTNPASRALAQGTTVGRASHILIHPDGREVPIEDRAAPIQDEQGRITGSVLIFREVPPGHPSGSEDLRQVDAASFLASIVESSEDAIIGVSLEGIIQSWNNAAERLYRYAASEVVGRPVTMLIPSDRGDEEGQIIARILAGQRISHFDTVRCDRNGRSIPVSLTISPVRDKTGAIVGTSKIVRDITEAKDAERRIYSLMSELREADARKDEFLAILAHELRGPLAPIRHRLEILRLADDNPPLREESLRRVDQQVTQLVRLVDDLLDVSRITRNKLELRRETLDLGGALHQAVEIAKPLAETQGHQVIVSIPMQSMMIEADPVRIAQIFGNLLHNACKYSDPGATIWLSAERQGSDVRIAIRDNGIGIAPEVLPHLFELFTQVSSRPERTQGGLGIGLTLVRRLVAMHGGSIEARSEGLGKGSEFIVHLPLAQSRTGIAAAAPRNVLQGSPSRRILVVDDNDETAESLVMLLRLLGHETEMANDGQAALAVAERFSPEVMLLDIGLPKVSGYDVCERIRRQPWGRQIVIAAVSGWGQDVDRKKSADAGFDYHLVKPLDFTLLLRVLSEPRPQGHDLRPEAIR
jgi:PAS domain S-box-containing protein